MTSEKKPFPLLRKIYDDKLAKNRNVFFLFYSDGKSGYGKSYMAMSIASALDPSFTVDRIVFTLEDFLVLVTTLPPKTIILYDDAGVESDSRSFLSKMNRILRYVVESVRSKQISIFFTVPGRDMIESTVQVMSTLQFRVKEPGLAKVYLSKYSQYHNKYYFPGLFWVGNPHNNRERVKSPDPALVAAYEAKKLATQNKWYGQFLVDVRTLKEKEQPKMKDVDIAHAIFEKGTEKYRKPNGKFDVDDIAKDYKCSRGKAGAARAILNRLVHEE